MVPLSSSFFGSGPLKKLTTKKTFYDLRQMTAPPKHSSNNYRPEIDGLRAIAVLSVLFYHAGYQSFSGGFVGVDIFFVISGYLITRLLNNELESSGSINLYDFLFRRARRILPALIFTLVISSVAAIYFFRPQRVEDFGGSLLNAALSISNIFFYFESGYFDTDSKLKPLLHTWSLGVEEQFYLVWPIVMMVIARVRLPKLASLCAIAGASLAFSIIYINKNPPAIFFLMPFRVFEFMIGALVVSIEANTPRNGTALNMLFLLGIGLIATAIFEYDEKTQFPGLSALLPCIGASLCIFASNDSLFGRILRARLLVNIGLISYSLYLIHWPLIVFYKYAWKYNMPLRPTDSAGIIAVSLIVAWYMQRWIETPFRKITSRNRIFLPSIVLILISLVCLGVSMRTDGGWAWRPWVKSEISTYEIKKGKDSRFINRQTQCEAKGWQKCDDLIIGKTNVLIIGDSHAPDALNSFSTLFPENNNALSTLGGCPPYADIASLTLPTHPNLEECKTLNLKRFDVDYLKTFDYIVINVLFGWYKIDHLTEYLSFLKKNGIEKVIVIGGYLQLREDLPEVINKFGFDRKAIETFVIESTVDETQLEEKVKDFGYFFISKFKTFCANGTCEYFDDSHIPFTYDRHHLSLEFGSRIGRADRDALVNYLARGPH